MAANATVWSACSSCDRDTKHTVLHSKSESESEYRVETSYQIVECCGCGNVSFRRVVEDFEQGYQDEEGEWVHPADIVIYPGFLKGHKGLTDIHVVPVTIRSVYEQTLLAISHASSILAGIGLRAIIEAICNERKVTGRNLENRIDRLAKDGLISVREAERLHAIRFVGNDAAHEIHSPRSQQLLVALRIVENLITNVYLLDDAAESTLETIISTYPKFLEVLEKKIVGFQPTTEISLSQILGREGRRFHGYIKSHEATLKSNIGSGQYSKLKLGKLDSVNGSKEKHQHFIVV
ncbi:DUF4145 domain-containing protein [Paraburkholderia azotifigens]|uniref:DUF4145 domain-containing protein n=1 Tax=Paraburkholderia azotifigens TaxID=2057004 RepID=A0ABU9R3Z5_9BURK